MKFLKNSILVPTCFFILALVLAVGVSYKKNPYVVNIQYRSQQSPETDGVKKILVSHIDGVRNCTTENFEYNAEKNRYEYEISDEENTYLNLYLDPFQTFRCNLEYRLKYEDSVMDRNDGIVVTLYAGNRPVCQQIFLLLDGQTQRYQPELYIAAFSILFFTCFVLSMVFISQIVWKKKAHMIAVEGAVTGIWCLLWFCAGRMSALIEKSLFQRFAAICVFLLILAAIAGWRWGVRSEERGKEFVVNTAKRTLMPILFFAVTCCIYIPSSLFLGNIDEFIMPYHRIAGLILLYAAGSILVLFIAGLCIRSARGQYIYALVLFFVTMGFYVQSNFLNPSMPDLNGEKIDWTQYGAAGMRSTVGWAAVGVIFIAAVILVMAKKIKFEKPLRYVSGLLILMQMCSLGVMIVTCRVDPDLCRVCSTEGQFTVGDDNVVVFLVDTLQVDAVQTYLQNAGEEADWLQDFTVFTNTIGGGVSTEYAVPLILTGCEYDPAQAREEYYGEIWQEGCLLWDLQESGYDTRLYMEIQLLREMPAELAQNICETSGNEVENDRLFMEKLVRLANLYMMPLSLKEHFELDTEELKEGLAASGEAEAYNMDNVNFYEKFKAERLRKEEGKAFRFYHLWGVHGPLKNDEQMNRIVNNETNEERALQGVMLLIREYIDELKALGVYENSTVVIMGDHGRHSTEDAEKYPAILVKRAGESHPLQYSDAPVCFRNLVVTLDSEIKGDYAEYGAGLYDVDRESDVERLQTSDYNAAVRHAGYDGTLYADSETGVRFVVDDDGTGNLTYREWNPYEINRIQYTYGDVIDFRSTGSYADNLTERLYPAENGKTASNELTICFDLPDQKTGDLELGFTYAGVYNDAQKIRIYANGHKVDNVICSTDQIEKETSVVIPKQFVKDKPVIVRMVFPNAVTPNQLDRSNDDTRVLSVTFDKMWLKVANS